MNTLLISIVVILLGVVTLHSATECNYPTFYDSGSDRCVETCPQGTIGNANRSDNTTARNCTAPSAGYLITFNATEYEFDVNVYSPNETVVFEAFLVAENINADFVIRVGFNGAATEFDPYSINGMNSSVIITSTQSTDPLLTIRLEEPLDPNDDQIDYTFALAYLAAGAGVKSEEAKVIIHEIDPCDDCPMNATDCEPQSDGNVVCVCPPGYNGTNCGNYIGFCRSSPCLNGATCTEIINNFTCTCAPPLTGRFCEIDLINECDPNPCMNDGSCIDGINDFTCNCTSPWTGNICDVDGIDNCTDVDCNNGSCDDLVNDFQCNCDQGYTSRFCEINIDDCENVACLNNGSCIDQVNNFTCQCSPGYEGRFCSNATNECDPDPCVVGQGDCEDLFLDYRCNCHPDFTGRNCSARFNDCLSDPCQNNATCIDLFASYRCECPEGITGNDCETIVDYCDPNPCENNGTCTDINNDFMCDCVEGFTEKNCSSDIDDCTPNPCENNGTCTDLVNDFMCDCDEGFTGRNCSSNIDDCTPNPCENNGTCTDLVNGFMCDCDEGFTGRNCSSDVDDCTPNPCENNGTCTDLVNDFVCDCDKGFTERNCSKHLNDNCTPNPCKNGGTCNLLFNDYTCTCPTGYTSTNCSELLDFCVGITCMNSGTCINMPLMNNYSCACRNGYIGSICEVQNGCFDYPAYYSPVSGECVLTCPPGSIGSVNGTIYDFTFDRVRNCTSLSPGYITTFNATQYEFDVNVYSPVGTVVFESLLVVENINDLLIMIVNFEGSRHEFVPFSLNGMGDSVTFDVVKTNILLTITLDETLNPNDTTVEYNFTLQYFIAGFDISQSGSVNVLLYEVDPCDDCPMNATCEPQFNGNVVCVCPPGFTGTFCENYIGFCHTNPCMNSGTCMEIANNFTCSCTPPLTGSFCDVDLINECDPNPCANGNCTDLIDSYNCTCFEGFTDNDCSTNIDDCDPNPCMNNGRCVDGINDFICNCVSPWIGIVCNINSINNCTDVNCSSRSSDTDEELLPYGAVIAIACAATLIITAIITFILTYVIIKRCRNPNKRSSLRMSYESVWPLSYTAKRTDLEMQQSPACVTKHEVFIEENPNTND